MKKKRVKDLVMMAALVLLVLFQVIRWLMKAETPFGALMITLGLGLYALVDWGVGKLLQNSVKDAPFQKDLKDDAS